MSGGCFVPTPFLYHRRGDGALIFAMMILRLSDLRPRLFLHLHAFANDDGDALVFDPDHCYMSCLQNGVDGADGDVIGLGISSVNGNE